MKAVILAGGRGSRMGEESLRIPKPMIEIGGRPILWHIMKQLAGQGISDFVILLGYKGYVIKEYFANFLLHEGDCSIDLGNARIEFHEKNKPNWKVTLAETGIDSLTGTRIRKASRYFASERFLLTYGDGLADINLSALLSFHQAHGKLVSVTAVQPVGRFGSLNIDERQLVSQFNEKPKESRRVNGGYFICEPAALEFLDDSKDESWEARPLENLSKAGELMAYSHDGFWQCMDSPREKEILEELWKNGNPAWLNSRT